MSPPAPRQLSGAVFVGACAFASVVLAGFSEPISAVWIAVEILTAVLLLFLFGSFRYRLDKNAVTLGAGLVVGATFWSGWWPTSGGWTAFPSVLRRHFSFDGLDHLVHLDTMLFIFGLTVFVSAVTRTRLLESAALRLLSSFRGAIFPTVVSLTAVVAAASGILDGVSMIGLLLRVLLVLLVLGGIQRDALDFAVVATMITTICGVWLAYGEPPNLIMKANLHPRLTDAFFLRYGMPLALAAYAVLFVRMRRLSGRSIDLGRLSFAQRHAADLTFMAESGLVTSTISEVPAKIRTARRRTQAATAVAFVPFGLLLIWHGADHRIPLFAASFAGAAAALLGLAAHPRLIRRALGEAAHEFSEYLFLLPLFFSIALLARTGFFETLAAALESGTSRSGALPMALAQFGAATGLSALLDNNVVADFASRALSRFPDGTLHLYAMAQIAGYALGGCWTHIGSAQSVVAYTILRRETALDATPLDWIRRATPLVLQIFAAGAALICLEAFLLGVAGGQ